MTLQEMVILRLAMEKLNHSSLNNPNTWQDESSAQQQSWIVVSMQLCSKASLSVIKAASSLC